MPSFDISSEVDLQEMDNAVNQAVKEIVTRYDFRGSKSSIRLDKEKNILHLVADDDFKMKAVIDLLQNKILKRGISLKSIVTGRVEDAGGSLKKCDMTLVMGIEQDKAKEIIRMIKDSGIKVQAQIQEEKVRVTGKKRDELQEVIASVKAHDFGIPLQFGNYRD